MALTKMSSRPRRNSKSTQQVEKAPIEAILTHYGAVRVPERVRGWAAMRCPFHDDSSASASVNTSEGLFKCHACGIKGDGITIVREQERQDFASAVQTIAGIIGRGLQGVSGTASKRGSRTGTGLLDDNPRPVKGQTSLFQVGLR